MTCWQDAAAEPNLPGGFGGDSPLPPVWAYDDQVPADLAARWTASDEGIVLVKDFTRSMTAIGGVLLMAAGLIALVVGSGLGVVGVASAVVGALAIWSARHARRRDRLMSGAFSPQEVDVILAHRRQVRFQDWDTLTGADAPRQVVAARRAVALAKTLTTQPEWTCDQLAMHRMRMTPSEEARQIQLAARDLHDRELMLTRSARGDIAAPEMESAIAQWRHRLDLSSAALDARLAAFEAYVGEVTAVTALIGQANSANRLTTELLIQEPVMTMEIVVHEQVTADVERLRQELFLLRTDLGQWSASHDQG